MREYSQANWTLPSHASIFTGKYNTEHMQASVKDFSEVENPIQEVLSKNGYTTYGFSNIPNISEEFNADKLFDEFEYVSNEESLFSNLGITREKFYSGGLGQRLKLFKKILFNPTQIPLLWKRLKDKILLRDSGADSTNKLVKDTILEDENEPFFLFLNYSEPHGPYKPPVNYALKFLERKMDLLKIHKYHRKDKAAYLDEDKEPEGGYFDLLESWYEGEIAYLDSKIKEIFEEIRKEYPNTVFLFTADHGEYFYEHGRIGHLADLHEEVTRVPLIEVMPYNETRDVKGLIELKDIYNHLKTISGSEISLMKPCEYAFSEALGDSRSRFEKENICGDVVDELCQYKASVASKNHRLIWYSDGNKKLFSLPDQNKIVDNSVEEDLSERIESKFGSPEEKEFDMELAEPKDKAIKEELKKLGYL